MLGVLIWQVVLGRPLGKNPMSNGNVIFWTIFLWLIYFRLITIRLVTDVKNGQLAIKMRGAWRTRRVALSDIQSTEVIDHDPARDYGGYGVRFTREGKAYIASGGLGVKLILKNGEKVIIGSRRPNDLVSALHQSS